MTVTHLDDSLTLRAALATADGVPRRPLAAVLFQDLANAPLVNAAFWLLPR